MILYARPFYIYKHNIMDIADIETRIQHYIATGPSSLYVSCWVTKSGLNKLVWTVLAKIMSPWRSLPAQPPEWYYYYQPTQ